MQKQRQAHTGRLGLAVGAGLCLVALAHPVFVDRAELAVAVTLAILSAAAWAAIGEGSASGLPRVAWWLAISWLLGLLVSAWMHQSWEFHALLPPTLSAALLWLGARVGKSGSGTRVGHWLVGAATITALHAALQHVSADPLGRLDEFPGRVVGPFDNPNHLGSFAALALPLALAGYVRLTCRSARRHWGLGLLQGGFVVTIYTGLLLAGSRGAIWAAAAGSLVTIVCSARALHLRSQRPAWLPLLLLALASTGVTRLLQEQPIMQGPTGQVSVGQRLEALPNIAGEAAKSDVTVLHRRVLWRAGWEIFLARPLFGVGPGGYQLACATAVAGMSQDPRVATLSRLDRLDITRFAHNEWLHSLAETGLAGTVPWTILVFYWVWISARAFWRGTGWLHWGALGACSSVLIHGLVSYPFFLPATAGCFWMLLGITIYCGSRVPEPCEDTR